MAKKSKAPKSSVVPLSVARRRARAQQLNDDLSLARRHQAALKAIDQADACTQIHGEIIRDFISSRDQRSGSPPMATSLPEPEPRPMATRLPPYPDNRALIGIAISSAMVVAAILGAAWLAKP